MLLVPLLPFTLDISTTTTCVFVAGREECGSLCSLSFSGGDKLMLLLEVKRNVDVDKFRCLVQL